jgi:phospholipid/cholesterol/gamma-HCH transport system permease protein
LAAAVPERKGARREDSREKFLDRVGTRYLDAAQSVQGMLGFVGEVFLAYMKLLRGKAQFRRSDLMQIIQRGTDALPIVSLISLCGADPGHLGAVQLKIFGAQIYVATLVAIYMRVMVPLWPGSSWPRTGRLSPPNWAPCGSMRNRCPADPGDLAGEFLVLPRVLGLSLMMPLLAFMPTLWG